MRQRVGHGSAKEQGNNREVGYCQPPREHQFKPGQSGNPQGRPAGTVSLRTLLKEKLAEVSAGDERRTYGQMLVDETFELALSGSAAALRLVWEYVDGKPSPYAPIENRPSLEDDDAADAYLYDDVARELLDDWLTRISSDECREAVRQGRGESMVGRASYGLHEPSEQERYGQLGP